MLTEAGTEESRMGFKLKLHVDISTKNLFERSDEFLRGGCRKSLTGVAVS